MHAFISSLYRIFQRATDKHIPSLERFKYLCFIDELIHEQLKAYPTQLSFQEPLTQFITEYQALLECDLLPQLAENGFVYQKEQKSVFDNKADLFKHAAKIKGEIRDFYCVHEHMFNTLKDNHLNCFIIWHDAPHDFQSILIQKYGQNPG